MVGDGKWEAIGSSRVSDKLRAKSIRWFLIKETLISKLLNDDDGNQEEACGDGPIGPVTQGG